MPDGKLQYEIEVTGTAAASAGLAKVETGLDRVAAAEKRTRDSAYGARQAHENWVSGYRGETFSEIAEKIKRVSHVSRETNPNLKWMGEGFRAAKNEAVSAGSAINQLRSVTVSASSASLAYSRLMHGDFVGAARAAGMAVKSLWTVMLANPFTAVLAGIAAAVAGLKMLMDWHDAAKEKAREHAREVSALGDALNEVLYGSVPENVRENTERMVQAGDREGLQKSISGREKANAQLAEQAAALKNAIAGHEVGGFGGEKEQKVKDEMVAQYNDVLAQMKENKASIIEFRRGIAELDKPNGGSGGGSSGKSGASSDERLLEEATQKRQRLDREMILAQTVDPLARAYQQKAMLTVDRKKYESEDTPDSKLKVVEIDREIFDLEQNITAEIERRNSARAKEEDSLKIRMEEYRLSRLTTAEQLKAVDAKMAALRKGPKNTETEGQMLDLQIRRDALAERLAADRRENPSRPDQEDDDSDEGRRVVDGADYSMKEFNPRKRRFRGMGRQGFMGKGRGHASEWFANQTASRFAAAGHVGVPSEMGRPQMDVKGIDQTNRLLTEIKERL